MNTPARKKLISISEAAALVKPGDTIGLGGNVLHRAPMALIREIVRRQTGDLALVKTAGAMDIDLLCLAGLVRSVDAGFVSYETAFGLAQHYRRAVQSGKVAGHEHACYTVISALRAAQAGIPFMPVRGLMAGDLLKVNDYFQQIEDPFGSGTITVVKALVPDIALIHVQEADEEGNAFIQGPIFEDVLLSRASRQVIISTERLIPASRARFNPDKVQIPSFLAAAVVHTPGGAAPGTCPGFYEADEQDLNKFLALKDASQLPDWLAAYERRDHSGNSGKGVLK